jgi:hypothetical protein
LCLSLPGRRSFTISTHRTCVLSKTAQLRAVWFTEGRVWCRKVLSWPSSIGRRREATSRGLPESFMHLRRIDDRMHTQDSTHGGPKSVSTLPQVTLEITRGRAKQRTRQVRGQAFLIGSAADSDLVLGDARFDELYGYVMLRPEQVTIRRLGVGPELCVRDEVAGAAMLEHGDRLRLGPFEFRVGIEWKTGQKPAPKSPLIFQAPGNIDEDAALERLLRDVERYRPAAPLRLYAG